MYTQDLLTIYTPNEVKELKNIINRYADGGRRLRIRNERTAGHRLRPGLQIKPRQVTQYTLTTTTYSPF